MTDVFKTVIPLLVLFCGMLQGQGLDHLCEQDSQTSWSQKRSGLQNALRVFESKSSARVAFLGGSITYNPGWRDSVMQYLQHRFPDTEFDFIAAGIPSMGSTPGAFRFERDVLRHGRIDLLFEEAAVNDFTNGRSTQEQVRAMEGIVRHARAYNPIMDIVFMYFVDPDKIDTYRANDVPLVIKNHEKVAMHYNIPSINLAREVTDRMDAGEFTWADDFKDLHPSPFGQGIYARSIICFLENAWEKTIRSEKSVRTHPLPDKLDRYSYDAGRMIEVTPEMVTEGWKYDPNWIPLDGANTRPNYTHVPMLIGNEPDSLLKFRFKGTAVGIAVASGPDAGVIEYRIDDEPWKVQDLLTKWSGGLHLPWFYTLDGELDEGNHLLEIRLKKQIQADHSGNTCRIRYFYVNE